MTDLPKRNFCHYCKRELREGEGRYRLFQQEEEVDCCLSCFDTTNALPPRLPEEPPVEQTICKAAKEF